MRSRGAVAHFDYSASDEPRRYAAFMCRVILVLRHTRYHNRCIVMNAEFSQPSHLKSLQASLDAQILSTLYGNQPNILIRVKFQDNTYFS